MREGNEYSHVKIDIWKMEKPFDNEIKSIHYSWSNKKNTLKTKRKPMDCIDEEDNYIYSLIHRKMRIPYEKLCIISISNGAIICELDLRIWFEQFICFIQIILWDVGALRVHCRNPELKRDNKSCHKQCLQHECAIEREYFSHSLHLWFHNIFSSPFGQHMIQFVIQSSQKSS